MTLTPALLLLSATGALAASPAERLANPRTARAVARQIQRNGLQSSGTSRADAGRLVQACSSEEPTVRETAAQLIGWTQAEEAAAALLPLAADPEPRVQSAARDAAGRIGWFALAGSIESGWSMLDPDATMRLIAAVGSPAAGPFVVDRAGGADAGWQRAALTWLKQPGDAQTAAILYAVASTATRAPALDLLDGRTLSPNILKTPAGGRLLWTATVDLPVGRGSFVGGEIAWLPGELLSLPYLRVDYHKGYDDYKARSDGRTVPSAPELTGRGTLMLSAVDGSRLVTLDTKKGCEQCTVPPDAYRSTEAQGVGDWPLHGWAIQSGDLLLVRTAPDGLHAFRNGSEAWTIAHAAPEGCELTDWLDSSKLCRSPWVEGDSVYFPATAHGRYQIRSFDRSTGWMRWVSPPMPGEIENLVVAPHAVCVRVRKSHTETTLTCHASADGRPLPGAEVAFDSGEVVASFHGSELYAWDPIGHGLSAFDYLRGVRLWDADASVPVAQQFTWGSGAAVVGGRRSSEFGPTQLSYSAIEDGTGSVTIAGLQYARDAGQLLAMYTSGDAQLRSTALARAKVVDAPALVIQALRSDDFLETVHALDAAEAHPHREFAEPLLAALTGHRNIEEGRAIKLLSSVDPDWISRLPATCQPVGRSLAAALAQRERARNQPAMLALVASQRELGNLSAGAMLGQARALEESLRDPATRAAFAEVLRTSEIAEDIADKSPADCRQLMQRWAEAR